VFDAGPTDGSGVEMFSPRPSCAHRSANSVGVSKLLLVVVGYIIYMIVVANQSDIKKFGRENKNIISKYLVLWANEHNISEFLAGDLSLKFWSRWDSKKGIGGILDFVNNGHLFLDEKLIKPTYRYSTAQDVLNDESNDLDHFNDDDSDSL
jgi:hypothetical protein